MNSRWSTRAAALLCIAALLVGPAGCSDRAPSPAEQPTAPAPVVPVPKPVPDDDETIPAGQPFATDESELMVLWSDRTGSIGVTDNRLVLLKDDGSETIVYEFAQASIGRWWPAGDRLLAGFVPVSGSDGYHTWLGIEPGDPVRVTEMQEWFGPQLVRDARTVKDPALVILTVDNSPPGYTEFVYSPDQAGFAVINPELSPQTTWDDLVAARPEAKERPTTMVDVQRYPFPDGDVVTVGDDRGTIVLILREHVWAVRYFQHQAIRFVTVPDLDGRNWPVGWFRSEDGTDVLSLPDWGFFSYLLLDPRLFEDGWGMVEPHRFFRVRPQAVEVIGYRYDPEGMSAPIARTYDLDGAQYGDRDGSLLRFVQDGQDRYLSLYDVLNWEPQAGQAGTPWLYPAERTDGGSDTRPFPWEYPTATVRLPRLTAGWERPGERITGLLPVVEGDYDPAIVARQSGDRTLVLVDDRLYTISGSQLQLVGTVPVTVAHTVGEGVSGRTAQDVLGHGGNWYVADTFGDRVIRLDADLKVTAVAPVPAPFRLEQSQQKLLVTAADGATTFDLNLRPEGTMQVPLVQVDLMDHILARDSMYVDEGTGLTWYFSDGQLGLCRADAGVGRSIYLGDVHNANGRPRLIPWRDRVVVLFDNRAFLFDRDGQWQSTIRFPRPSPDGIYVSSPDGENSWQLLPDGRLFLVQGFGVLAIDLKTGSVTAVFRQTDANLGPLLFDGQRLCLSLVVENVAYGGRPAAYTELAVINPDTGKVLRSFVSGRWATDRLTASGNVVLWSFSEPRYGERSGTWLSVRSGP